MFDTIGSWSEEACTLCRASCELVVLGGRVLTMDPARPWAEAVAIRGTATSLWAAHTKCAGPGLQPLRFSMPSVEPSCPASRMPTVTRRRQVVDGCTWTCQEPPNPPSTSSASRSTPPRTSRRRASGALPGGAGARQSRPSVEPDGVDRDRRRRGELHRGDGSPSSGSTSSPRCTPSPRGPPGSVSTTRPVC